MNNVHVAVCLVTYNQEKYIEQAINSVLSQQTTFPVDIVVGNDCSIDSTAEVLQRILENTRRVNRGVIVFNRENNLGIVGNTIDLFRYILSSKIIPMLPCLMAMTGGVMKINCKCKWN